MFNEENISIWYQSISPQIISYKRENSTFMVEKPGEHQVHVQS